MVAPARSVIGRLTTALPPGTSGRWDRREVEVCLSFGTLSSRSEEDVFNGANLLAVESQNGSFEVLQFQSADLQPNGHWQLAKLLRGQGGSEIEAQVGAPIGARVVLLTPAVTQAVFPADLRGLALDWLAGPEKDIPGTANFSSKNLTVQGRGLTPLAPVHLRAKKAGDDIHLSWIRRTRIHGDNWEGEVPLNERDERYAVSIFDGERELRRVETTNPEYFYKAGEIAQDFGAGGPSADFAFSIAQTSDLVGDGFAAKREVILN